MRTWILQACLLLGAAGCGGVGPTGSGSGEPLRFTGPMVTPRMNHAAALLPGGRVLIAGGVGHLTPGSDATLASAEVYDPGSGTFSPTGSMPEPRVGHVAVALPDGRVLVAGGGVKEALVYDPDTGTFAVAGATVALDGDMTAETLDDGRVFLMTSFSDRPEVFDPATGAFVQTVRAGIQRFGNTVTRMADGTLALIGGGIRLAEVYFPLEDRYLTVSGMVVTRFGHAATRLQDGRILVTGGSTRVTGGPYAPVANAELFDPASRSFATTGSMSFARFGHTSVLLPGGDVLIVGGAEGPAERYRTAKGTFETLNGEAARGRAGATATLLADGRVLIAGGLNESYGLAERAAIYEP